MTEILGLTPDGELDLGSMSSGNQLFLLVKNGLERLPKNGVLEVISTNPHIKDDVKSWCRLHSYRFIGIWDGGDHSRLFIQNSSSRALESADWGVRLPIRKEGRLDLRDWLQGRTGKVFEQASAYVGFVPRGAVAEPGVPDYGFTINRKDLVWADNLLDLYEQAKESQWNAASDIPWEELPELPEELEWAVCQIMTFLAENEYSALYIPSKFMSRINPHYIEVLMYLSTLVQDEARHIEAFMKRAMANGGGLQYSSVLTERSLYSLFVQEDYFKSSFLLHVLGEGTFLDLLNFVEEHAPDPVTRRIVHLAKMDEGRHVAYGIGHVRQMLAKNPEAVQLLVEAAEQRNEYMTDAGTSENSHLMEALAILAGKGRKPEQLSAGFRKVDRLKEIMYGHRVQRMLQAGIDQQTAEKISSSHTPNFM
ncbi:sulfurtransferase TusA family protein [Ammoniphilus sp. 3BR4]|uniref:sulfurtransferase TusA family protein n=1 Tax=Ammoniphilus sp. 3BR4 TaxID=3158265 RepID=UPI00346671DF